MKKEKKLLIGGIVTTLLFVGTFKFIDILKGEVYLKAYSQALEVDEDKETEDVEEVGSLQKYDPTKIIKGGNIIGIAKDYAVPSSDVSKILANTYKNENKSIFLTFDDGPTSSTKSVLDILDKENINATFFVLGTSLEKDGASEIVKDTIYRGNAIANHTYTHNYKTLYPSNTISVDTFMREIEKTGALLKNILGEDFNTSVIRLPGGYMSREHFNDKNLESLDARLLEKNIVQIDWNAENGDGITFKESVDEMVSRVIKQTENQDHIVVLMHDSLYKEKTIEALPKIIKHFKSLDYEFKVIANDNVFNQ